MLVKYDVIKSLVKSLLKYFDEIKFDELQHEVLKRL